MFNQKKIQRLEERTASLEKERGELSWESFPYDIGNPFTSFPGFRYNKLTGHEILTRINELYDYLGVTRETSPQLTKLRKRHAS